jgi:Lon protease-like protein
MRLYSREDDADFMRELRTRMEEVSNRDTKIPIVVLDTMLPRQVLKIEVSLTDNQVFVDLVRSLVEAENPSFGMVGSARLTTGQNLPLQNGVEVEIVGTPHVVESGLRVELRGGRRMKIAGELSNSDRGWTEARVQFLDSVEEEKEEETGDDPLALARATQKARELTSPNFTIMEGGGGSNKSLIDRWIELARKNELQPEQIDRLLRDLGEMPTSDEPTELAMWVGALINPLPGMGVALEIRPALLMSKTAEERVQVALEGIRASINHMDGSKRLF